MLLGLFVALMLGSYLYQSIADGLVNDRILTARAEATAQARAAQSRFDSAGRMDAVSLTQLAFDVVGQLSSPGADQSREVILTRAMNNTVASAAHGANARAADRRPSSGERSGGRR